MVLGSTGSIGQSALKVARDLPQHISIVGLAAARNYSLLARQYSEFLPQGICLADESLLGRLRENLPPGTRVLGGASGLEEMATWSGVDLVLIAIVGTAGLFPALAAVRAGKDIAIASKEILVMAGGIVMEEARRHGVRVLPVDSEHNAIFQCLEGRSNSDVRRLILTASGGPFRNTPASEFESITPERALKHPTWDMGKKITIDSATLFNKGLEMIEAHWLFDVAMDRVDVIIHPQSVVHSMVEFIDASILAQLSHSDMCFPIQYAFTWPDRVKNSLPPLDFATLRTLEFEAPRFSDFPALDLARHAGNIGGTLPAVLNAANEVAVAAFLEGRTTFPGIWRTVAAVMEKHDVIANPSLADLLSADAWARRTAQART